MREIDRLSGGEAIVTTDVGQHQMWAAQFIRFNKPRLWLSSGGLGSMGFGLPSAIGASFANPDKTVFAIVGDGGFQMSVPELATLANHGLNVKVVIINNGYLGMVRQWQGSSTTTACAAWNCAASRISKSWPPLTGCPGVLSKARLNSLRRSKPRRPSRARSF